MDLSNPGVQLSMVLAAATGEWPNNMELPHFGQV